MICLHLVSFFCVFRKDKTSKSLNDDSSPPQSMFEIPFAHCTLDLDFHSAIRRITHALSLHSTVRIRARRRRDCLEEVQPPKLATTFSSHRSSTPLRTSTTSLEHTTTDSTSVDRLQHQKEMLLSPFHKLSRPRILTETVPKDQARHTSPTHRPLTVDIAMP
jgi:hypothetical protein